MTSAKDPLEEHCESFVWHGRAGALADQPIAKATSWAGAIQQDVIKFRDAKNFESSAAKQDSYLLAAVIMMVKDEHDIIGENLIWLHHIGVRRFIILDNNSRDDTRKIIEKFKHIYSDSEVLILDDPIVRYMQCEKTTGLYRLAISIWPDLKWVIPIDADEFLIAVNGLGVLDQLDPGIDSVVIPKVVHYPSAEQKNKEMSAMARMPLRGPLFYFPPKIIARNNLSTVIEQGNHKISFCDHREIHYAGGLSLGFYYREYPTRSFEHFLRKTRNGGRAIKAAQHFLGRDVGGHHWLAFYNELLSGGEERLLHTYQKDWIKEQHDNIVHDPFVVDASIII